MQITLSADGGKVLARPLPQSCSSASYQNKVAVRASCLCGMTLSPCGYYAVADVMP
jgi:hypothetical protein